MGVRGEDPTLAVEFLAFAVYAIGWESAGAAPTGGLQLALLLVNAVALGTQSAAIQRFGNSDLSTTYLTGTLTRIVSRLVSGETVSDVAHGMQILAGLMVGAACGGLVVLHAPHWAPLIQLGSLGVVLVTAWRRWPVRRAAPVACP